MELNPIVKQALIDIDFVGRYEKLSEEYNEARTPDNKRLDIIDGELIMDIISNLGYQPSFNAREKFFKIKKEKIQDYSFGFHIAMSYGMVELIWVVEQGKDVLLGSPWSVYSRRLINPDYRIKMPVCGDYDELEDVLMKAFKMYEDFKNAFLEIAEQK
ncbi:hypothetical protein [Streptococcus oricebi]|uniref:Uncharacterized protein n=1 Tax=Streptococcus oricebi TaxID=1547447 RepID=A0ABS5B4U5_9STRE|nr:hypothetical protein [Streptococcus oricebi]MBP2623834.1 hypothetical protein [Streptococcus oricebi]